MDVAVDLAGARAKRVEGLYDCRDEHGEGKDNDDVEGCEYVIDGGVPADGVVGAEDALRPEEVDDEDEEDAGGDEDLGGDGKSEVGWEGDGGDAECAGCYAGHAEAWDGGHMSVWDSRACIWVGSCIVVGGMSALGWLWWWKGAIGGLTEHHAVEQKLVSSPLVVLEDGHVCRCADDV